MRCVRVLVARIWWKCLAERNVLLKCLAQERVSELICHQDRNGGCVHLKQNFKLHVQCPRDNPVIFAIKPKIIS